MNNYKIAKYCFFLAAVLYLTMFWLMDYTYLHIGSTTMSWNAYMMLLFLVIVAHLFPDDMKRLQKRIVALFEEQWLISFAFIAVVIYNLPAALFGRTIYVILVLFVLALGYVAVRGFNVWKKNLKKNADN